MEVIYKQRIIDKIKYQINIAKILSRNIDYIIITDLERRQFNKEENFPIVGTPIKILEIDIKVEN